MERAALLSAIREDLAQAGLTGASARSERLSGLVTDYAILVAGWAPRINLTGARDPRDIARRFVIPPLIWSRLLPRSPGSIADLGSGAGFPGIPLALGSPDVPVVCVESRERRHYFQRQVVRELGLEQVQPLLGRAEALQPRRCDLGVAQAMAPLPEAVFHVKRWVSVGGVIAIPQSEPRTALDDDALEWLGCPAYRDPWHPRPGFLWMARRKV